jgi:hypothetical protein
MRMRETCAARTEAAKYLYFKPRGLMALISTIKVETVVRQPQRPFMIPYTTRQRILVVRESINSSPNTAVPRTLAINVPFGKMDRLNQRARMNREIVPVRGRWIHKETI